jgi:hypothetical protein
MKQLKYTVQINATPAKVWETLWNDATYRKWTAAFQEGSWYEGSLEEGSIIRMFDPENNGMYNRVLKNLPEREMTFKHLGWIYDGVESPQDWEESTETYQLEDLGGRTLLTAKVIALDEFVGFYESKFPKALQNIKDISEV